MRRKIYIYIPKQLQNASFVLLLFAPLLLKKTRHSPCYDSSFSKADPQKSLRSKPSILKLLGYIALCLIAGLNGKVQASVSSGADQLIKKMASTVNVGALVFDLTTGKTLFRYNDGQMFIPASNMKLFSDAAALMVLGPDYRFKNQLSTNALQLRQGVLYGNLYLHLSGDPSFSQDRLRILLASLQNWHIKRIQGNVIIDSSHANVAPYAPGLMKQDLAYGYGAPVAPVMIDANRMTVTVNPADKVGLPAIVEVEDNIGNIQINNQVITKEKGIRCGVDFSIDQDNRLHVSGCMHVGQWAVQQKLAIRHPFEHAQGLIKQQLLRENIQLDGQVLLGKSPNGSLLLANDFSKPIAQIMADTLKPSDNLYADSLFLHAAEKLNGAPVNWGEAQSVVREFLQQQTGIDLRKAIFTDGSGLSRFDRLSPIQTASLLRFLFERFPLSYEYIAALPVSGRDGTLQRRFKQPGQQDMVRAKTGTMTGVASLSGYLYTANAHTLAFAIFVNSQPGVAPKVSGRSVIDALCNYFLKQNPNASVWTRMFTSEPRIQYQLKPTQADLERGQQAKWRRLEAAVKQALTGQSVTVIFRSHELVLKDNQADAARVLNVLQNLRKKYAFSAYVSTKNLPSQATNTFVLWTDAEAIPEHTERVWTIREAIS